MLKFLLKSQPKPYKYLDTANLTWLILWSAIIVDESYATHKLKEKTLQICDSILCGTIIFIGNGNLLNHYLARTAKIAASNIIEKKILKANIFLVPNNMMYYVYKPIPHMPPNEIWILTYPKKCQISGIWNQFKMYSKHGLLSHYFF